MISLLTKIMVVLIFSSIIEQPQAEAEEGDGGDVVVLLPVVGCRFLLGARAWNAARPGVAGAEASQRTAPRGLPVRWDARLGRRHGPQAEAQSAQQEDRRASPPEESRAPAAVGLEPGRGPGARGPGAGGRSGEGGGEAEADAHGVPKEVPSAAVLSGRPQMSPCERKGDKCFFIYKYVYTVC